MTAAPAPQGVDRGLDRGALERLATKIGPERLADIIDAAIRSASEACRAMRPMAGRGDFAGVAAIVEDLKASCAALGSPRLLEHLERLDLRTRGHPLAGPLPEIGLVLTDLGAFLDEVRREQRSLAKTPEH